MSILNTAIRVWQKAPRSWRARLVASPLAAPLRRFVNRLVAPDPQIFELAEPLQGYRMRLHWQTQKAFVFGTHERDLVETIQRLVQPGWLALDLGAHIGYSTLLLSKHVGPAGRVIAFEPMPEIFSVLRENVLLNSCHNVLLEQKAVTERSGPIRICRMDADPLTSRTSIRPGADGIDVAGIALDDYLASVSGSVQFVKIDVECAEAAVLRGMSRLLERDRPLIFLEAHEFESFGDAHPAMQILRQAGYRLSFASLPGAQAHILAVAE